jgi:hypothetical protein
LSAGQKKEATGLTQVALDSLEPLFSKRPSDRSLLLATVNTRLLCAIVSADESTSMRMLGNALAAIEAVKSGAGDPRLLALRVEVLLGLGRRDEAHDIIRKLWDSGYRDPALVALLQHADIEYPVNMEFQKQLEQSSLQQRT